MSVFDSISNALRAKKAPDAAALSKLLVQVGADLNAARRRIEEIEAGRLDAVLAGDSGRVVHRKRLDDAVADAHDLQALAADIQRRLAEAERTEAEATRRAAFAEAKKLRAAAVRQLEVQYGPAVAALVALIREVAQADLAIEKANHDLPAGENELLSVEQIARDEPSLPRKIVSTRRVSRWCPSGTVNPLGDERAAKVVADQDNLRTGALLDHHGGRRHYFRVELVDFEEVRFLPARFGRSAERLVNMHLPPLAAADEDWWTPARYGIGATAVIDRLEARAALPAGKPERDDRREEVIYRVIKEDQPAPAQAAE